MNACRRADRVHRARRSDQN